MRAPSRKLLLLLAGLAALAFLIYRSSGFLHLGGFSGAKAVHAVREANPFYLLLSLVAIYGCYALRALRWKVFQQNLGPSNFWIIYKLTLAGFSALFLIGRPAEPLRPLLLARKEKLPIADMFGIYVLERIFDTASTAVIAAIGLLLFESHARDDATATTLKTAARTTGALLFVGVFIAVALLVYQRVHGTVLLERRLQNWRAAHGLRVRVARIILGFARGVQTIRTWRELTLAIFYSAAHWLLVLAIYFWVLHSFAGPLAEMTLGDAMLVLAFTLVGSVVQLPAVGGGSQAGTIVALTKIFNIGDESAFAAAIVVWLISFAACSLAGVPILIREGFSLGQLKELAEQEKKVLEKEAAASAGIAARPGEKPE